MLTKEKNAGIELLRIVAMLSIMALHVMGQGGVLANVGEGTSSYLAVWLLEILCYFGVTAYGLISGFVGIDGRYKVTNIIYTWLQVFFYTIIITSLFWLWAPDLVNGSAFLSAVFPVMTEQYWYFSAYFGVFFIMPGINYIIKNLDRRFVNIIAIFLAVVFSICPSIFSTDVFSLKEGYSFAWLAACYFFGAYIRKYSVTEKISKVKLLAVFILSVGLTYAFKVGLDLTIGKGADRLIAYNSPTILLAAVALLGLFAKLNPGRIVKRIALAVGPLTFGVYLSNSQPLVWKYLMKDRFAHLCEYNTPKMLICIVLAVLEIFLVGIAVDAARRLIFELGGLRRKLIGLNDLIMRRKCPCCQKGRVDKFEVCEVCGWENDPVQANDPNFKGGANEDSLNEHRAKFMENGR